MCKERKSTTRDEWRDCSLHAVTSSVIYYSTHTRKNVIYLFSTIKIEMVYWRTFGARKKKNKSADVIWRGFDNRSRSTTSEIKIHTEVTLLYNGIQHWPRFILNCRRSFYKISGVKMKIRLWFGNIFNDKHDKCNWNIKNRYRNEFCFNFVDARLCSENKKRANKSR